MSGVTYNAHGWNMLNWIVLPVAFACMLALAAFVVSVRIAARSRAAA